MSWQNILQKKWQDVTYVGFDIETSGAYPVGDHICELGAVKWRNGEIIDEFQTLIKPPVTMSDFIIGIHNITNEMVKEAPEIQDKISFFHDFIKDSILVAHHAPFDMGFITYEFEKVKLPLPQSPVFCSSIMARKIITGVPNHKLQTLIKYLNIDGGQAHRAKDDARACLEVLLHCFQKFEKEKNIQSLLEYQKTDMSWSKYSIDALKLRQNYYEAIIEAIKTKKNIQIYYSGGSSPGKGREVLPVGIVRNPNGDYLVGYEVKDQKPQEQSKRYYLRKIQDAG